MNDTRKSVYVDRRPPAATDNSSRFAVAAVVTCAVIGLMVAAFWAMAATQPVVESAPPPASEEPTEPDPVAEPEPEPAPEPPPEVVIPPAPASNQLSSNEWLLSPYAIVREGGNLTVTGTVQNLAAAQRSATLRVFVYVGGFHVATGAGEVRDVAGGGRVEVSLPSGIPWTAGNKVLLVTAEDLV